MPALFSEPAVLIAACAVLSAIAARLILLGFKRNHLGFVLLWMMIFPVTLVAVFVFIMPELRRYEARAHAHRFIAEDPLLSVASEADTGLARSLHEIMTEIVAEGHAGQAARLIAFRRSVGIITPLFEASVPTASDEALRGYLLNVFQVMRDLRGLPDAPCYWFITGSSRPDGSTLAAASDVKLEDLSAAMAEVILSARSRPVTPLGDEERAAYRREVFNRLEARMGPDFGDKLVLLDRVDRSLSDREVLCDVLLEIYSEILHLPPPLREGATRALLVR